MTPIIPLFLGEGQPAGSITRLGVSGFARPLYGSFSGKVAAVLVPPDDDDADTTVTVRTDCDGATIRPPRITMLHSIDSSRNADLHGADRLPMDRYDGRSIRIGRTPTRGHHARLFMFTSRAGESLPVSEVVLKINAAKAGQRIVSDTTGRVDFDGATLRVPATRIFHSSNSALNVDLVSVGTDRDRFFTRHSLPDAGRVGHFHRLLLVHDGTAGNAWCPEEIVLKINVVKGTARKRAT